jgi:hypothetical protein
VPAWRKHLGPLLGLWLLGLLSTAAVVAVASAGDLLNENPYDWDDLPLFMGFSLLPPLLGVGHHLARALRLPEQWRAFRSVRRRERRKRRDRRAAREGR